MSVSVRSATGSSPASAGDRSAGSGSLELLWHTEPLIGGLGTVVATGVFDLLHVGHLRFLRAARQAGERLVVGVEDDERTRARKGAGHPIVCVEERCEMLAALEPVDAVFAIAGRPHLEPVHAYTALLEQLRPSTLAFTEGDPAQAGKRSVATRLGAEVCVIAHFDGHSTSVLVERVLAAR